MVTGHATVFMSRRSLVNLFIIVMSWLMKQVLFVYVLQLVELIDGYRHVASIAQVANGDVDVIKSRVANLV